jgi:hypothetical protein
MWAQQAYSADLPQHVKSAAFLAGAHCPIDQALGDSRGPEKNYQICRVPRSEGLIGHVQNLQLHKTKCKYNFIYMVELIGIAQD